MLPNQTDYINLYFTLFEQFTQTGGLPRRLGRPFDYGEKVLIVFFTMMIIREVTEFKAQHRWLENHPQEQQALGFEQVPHRTTLSRRFKSLYETVQDFVAFVGQWAEAIHEAFDSQVLIEDASLFKARGPVWHQTDRCQGRIPKGLRNLDTEATWSKSGYHGWVYGYALHLTVNRLGLPKLVIVETGSTAEGGVLDRKLPTLLGFNLQALVGDNGYFQAMRVRRWLKQHNLILVTPAAAWKTGRFAHAYHRFIKTDPAALWLKLRRTAIEPVFDLFRHLLGTKDNHKQLPVQGLAKVRTFLALGVLAAQVAMIANAIWHLPFRQVAHFISVFK